MCAAEGLCAGPACFFFLLNHPSQRLHNPTEPPRTQPSWYLLRSVGLRPCAPCASLDPVAFISYSFTKSPVSAQCHLIPTQNTRAETKTRVWPGAQLHLNAQEMSCGECCFAFVLDSFHGLCVCFCFEHPRSSREGGVHSHCCNVRFANESTCWTGSFEWFVLNDSKGASNQQNSFESSAVTTLFAQNRVQLIVMK